MTIAGTNGKGHIAFGLESALVKNNFHVLRWTSPHLYSLCERIGFNGTYIEESTLEKLLDQAKASVEQYEFSFYELLFYIFSKFVLSQKEDSIDYLILEVGLGGRLDTTNFFDADCSCLTSVGLDHTEVLGNSLKQILLEKVEIARKEKSHFSLIDKEYLVEIEKRRIDEIGANFIQVDSSGHYVQKNNRLVRAIYQDIVGAELDDAFEISLGPGRLEKFEIQENQITFNSTHNLDGFRSALEFFRIENLSYDYLLIGFADRDETEINQILKLIKSYPCVSKELRMTSFKHQRALCDKIAQKISAQNGIPFVNYSEFFDTIVNKNSVLVTGSNYFLTEVREIF